jgi:hypothetical protein
MFDDQRGITWVDILLEVPNAILCDAALVDGAFGGLRPLRRYLPCSTGMSSGGPLPTVVQVGSELYTDPLPALQWYLNGASILEGNTPCITAYAIGDYTVVTTDLQGCVSQPNAPLTIITTGLVDKPTANDALEAFPNPGQGGFTLRRSDGEDLGPVRILSLDWRSMHELAFRSSPSLTIRGLSAGTHLVHQLDGAALHVLME